MVDKDIVLVMAVNFDFAGTNGSGLRGEVTELSGAGISSITTTLEEYQILFLFGRTTVKSLLTTDLVDMI